MTAKTKKPVAKSASTAVTVKDLSASEKKATVDLWHSSKGFEHDFGYPDEMPNVKKDAREAMFATLCKRGVVEVIEDGKDNDTFRFTDAGKALFVRFQDSDALVGENNQDDKENDVAKKTPVAKAPPAKTPAPVKGKKAPVAKAPAAKPAEAKETPSKGKEGVTGRMMDTMKALAKGGSMTHNQIAAVTGRDKGNQLRELTALGFVRTEKQEGTKGFLYAITAKGKKQL